VDIKLKNEIVSILNQAKAGQPALALERLEKVRAKKKKNILIEAAYVELLSLTNDNHKLIEVVRPLIKEYESNLTVYSALFNALVKVKNYEEAETCLRELLGKFGRTSKTLKLAQQLNYEKKEYAESLRLALEVVKLDPTSSGSFNNLGLAFSEMGMDEQAYSAFQTAVDLNGENIDAIQNFAYACFLVGKVEKAIELNECALKISKEKKLNISEDRIKWHLSFGYLYSGNLKKGWEYYDAGFCSDLHETTRRAPNRVFTVPKWCGEEIKDKTILVWREQGLGDELRYGSCLPDLIALAKKVIVECDSRLCKVLKDSMPELDVRPSLFHRENGKSMYKLDYDFHIPIASLPRYLRADRDSFLNKKNYIVPEPNLAKEISDKLNSSLNDGMKIGIAWRSGVLDPTRNKHYINLADWSDVLTLPGCHFINLQYGDVENELTMAEHVLGAKIHRWSDLDLKNDLEATFALISNLDLVITVGNAVASMAPTVGTETWQILPRVHWVELPGLNLPHYPWSKNLKNIHPDNGLSIATVMPKIRDAILDRLSAIN
jgi:pentatricopeptide repeat protein